MKSTSRTWFVMLPSMASIGNLLKLDNVDRIRDMCLYMGETALLDMCNSFKERVKKAQRTAERRAQTSKSVTSSSSGNGPADSVVQKTAQVAAKRSQVSASKRRVSHRDSQSFIDETRSPSVAVKRTSSQSGYQLRTMVSKKFKTCAY